MPHTSRVAVTGPGFGSIVRFRGLLLAALAKRGHIVTVYGPSPSKTYDDRIRALPEFETVRNVRFEYRGIPFDRTGTNPWRDLHTVWALATEWRRARQDVVLNCTIKPAVYGSLAARWSGIPAFSLITGRSAAFSSVHTPSSRLIEGATRFLCKCGLPHNQRVFFQNPDDRDFFSAGGLVRGPDQTVLVNGSGIDLEAFRPVALPDRLSFLMVARLLTEKGVREYVEAARCVRARHPEVAFRLAGGLDTAQRRRAIPKEEVQSWVAEGVIDYLGHVEDIREALSQASVFVLPSYYPEGQPRSILEALAMGRPVVTTDWNGCRETVEVGQNGFLVPPRDVASLVDTLQKFIEHPEQIAVMGRESRRLAEKKYNVHLVNRVIMETMDLA